MQDINHLSHIFNQSDMFSIAKSLHDNYQPFMLDCQVWELIERVIPIELYIQHFAPYKKTVVGHKIVNDIVMNYYYGERKIKYHLSKKYLNRVDEVSIFEFNIGNSRLDYARINGTSYAYEIKTELDTLEKLEKQLLDYSKAFENLYVVCHPDHYRNVKSKVPEYCGIITYNTKNTEFPFCFKQKKQKNNEIDPQFQLTALTSKELDAIIKRELNIKEINDFRYKERERKEEFILECLSKEKINYQFKETVKRRFRSRWEYVCEQFEVIEPIDVQSFYKSQANPFWVYYKNSSMV